jgi:UDP-N-acetylglucosamine 2-epimerase (non-hydrolysing)
MSAVFFEELGIRKPDHILGVGSGSHAQQTARVMERLEPLLEDVRPDAHLEAGLRSFDRSMPEELNRVVADAVAELHFIHSPEARDNLLREGVPEASIHDVGNTMIDTLFALRDRAEVRAAPERHGLTRGGYLVVTLHRPNLVDGPLLEDAIGRLAEVARELPVVFPVHPRTRAALDALPPNLLVDGLRVLPPLGYLEFLGLMSGAAGVLTDSGGIQEETTVLGIPCFAPGQHRATHYGRARHEHDSWSRSRPDRRDTEAAARTTQWAAGRSGFACEPA